MTPAVQKPLLIISGCTSMYDGNSSIHSILALNVMGTLLPG